ncbi:hypothetical protein SNEBB_008479 [Seison nebaliae]|nr:hypothetical protein SNEBB_008479 [Seison nebaliae]
MIIIRQTLFTFIYLSIPFLVIAEICEDPPVESGNLIRINYFARRDGDSITTGSSMTFQCKQNYKLKDVPEGLTQIQFVCGVDGKWTTPLATWPLECLEIGGDTIKKNIIPKKCVTPGIVQFAFKENEQQNRLDTDYAFISRAGSKITWACEFGYIMKGEPTVVCQENGMWTAQPICDELPQCDDPSKIEINRMRIKEVSSSWNPQRTIRISGTFAKLACINPKSPIQPEDGKMRCYNGVYTPDLSRINSCLEPEDITPEQADDATLCEQVPFVPNSLISLEKVTKDNEDDLRSGTKATFTCLEGFILSGNEDQIQIQCHTNGKWDEPTETCDEILMCPPMQSIQIPNAIVTEGKSDIMTGRQNAAKDGSYVTFVCINPLSPRLPQGGVVSCVGHELQPKDYVDWECLTPAATTLCEPFPEIEHAGIEKNFKKLTEDGDLDIARSGSEMVFSCEMGYLINGTNRYVCDDLGAWLPLELPECVEAPECPKPDTVFIKNAHQINLVKVAAAETPDRLLDGTYIQFSCLDVNSQLPYNGIVQCLDGKYRQDIIDEFNQFCPDKDKEFFSPKECPEPPTFPHALLLKQKNNTNGLRAVSSVINYECRYGYRQVAGSSLTCSEGQRWEGDDIKCIKLIPCINPSTFVYNKTILNRIAVTKIFDSRHRRFIDGSSMTFGCRTKHQKVIGNPVATCIDGVYKPDPADMVCEFPKLKTIGRWSKEKRLERIRKLFPQCTFPFTVNGKEYSQCITKKSRRPWCSRSEIYSGIEDNVRCTYTKYNKNWCVFPFKYKGVEYGACTMEDSDSLWCSTNYEFVSAEWMYLTEIKKERVHQNGMNYFQIFPNYFLKSRGFPSIISIPPFKIIRTSSHTIFDIILPSSSIIGSHYKINSISRK